MYRKYFSEQIIYYSVTNPIPPQVSPLIIIIIDFSTDKLISITFMKRTSPTLRISLKLLIPFSVSERINKPNLGADHLTFEGEYGSFQKKKIIVQISNEKTSCKEIPSIKWLCMSGEKIPSAEVSGKKKSYFFNKRSPYIQRSLLSCSVINIIQL